MKHNSILEGPLPHLAINIPTSQWLVFQSMKSACVLIMFTRDKTCATLASSNKSLPGFCSLSFGLSCPNITYSEHSPNLGVLSYTGPSQTVYRLDT